MRALLTFLGLSLSVAACGPSAPPAVNASPAPAAAPPPPGASMPAGDARRVRSRALDFPIELRLPSKDSWQLEERAWLVAKQASTRSELALRTWRADRLVRRAECLAQARLARATLPAVREEAVLDRRPFAAPAGLDSEIVVGVEPTEQGLSGYALVIGASVGRCYAAVFTTRADGAGSEQEIAARLGMAVDQVLGTVRIRSVDERAVRRRVVVTRPGE